MRFPDYRLVEQIEQKFRRIRDCHEKTSDCNSWALSFISAIAEKFSIFFSSIIVITSAY